MTNMSYNTETDLAREAYHAYGSVTDFKNFQGNPMPLWDDLPPKIREAWQAATLRVIEMAPGYIPKSLRG